MRTEDAGLFLVRCSGCGATDMTIWPKHLGVEHWQRLAVCGRWELVPPGGGYDRDPASSHSHEKAR